MSGDESGEQSSSTQQNPNSLIKDNLGIEEDNHNSNLFTSVWVKIEINDDDDDETTVQITEKELKKNDKKRGPYKKCDNLQDLNCEQCDYKTKHKNCLAFHILSHTNSKPFICTQCDYKTIYPVSLKRHVSVKHGDLDLIKPGLQTYKCSDCSYETQFKWNLSSHQRKHDTSKQHKCPHCSYSTVYKHSFVKHSRTHKKPEEFTYYCDKCPFATKYEGHITRHLAKIHFVVSEKASRCEHCSFSTKTGWRLNVHKKRSRQDSPVKCAHCEYQTIYRCAFKQHKLTHNGGNRNDQQWLDSLFTTDTNLHSIQNTQNPREEQALEIMKMCEIRSKIEIDAGTNLNESTKIFDELKSKLNNDPTYYTLNYNNDSNNVSLPNILQESEDDKNKYYYTVDPTCDVNFSNIQVKESTNHDRPFQCITCTYTAKFKASVQRHYQRHHTSHNRPYKCVNCDFCTKTKDQIALHNKRSRSEAVLACIICGFTSVFKCQFLMHEKEHYPFKCVRCEFRCKKKPDMQKHFTIMHLGNKLKCSHCDFIAIKKESLLSHEALHTGKKPFQCQLCEYTSVRRSLLENHINRFHKTPIVEEIIDDSKIDSLKRNVVAN